MQEVQRRKIVVPDKDIAEAIREIEQRNGMRPGQLAAEAGLRRRQPAHADRPDPYPARLDPGAAPAVGRQVAGDRCRRWPSSSGCEAQLVGKPEYRVGEIFIPVDDPASRADARALRRDGDRRIAQGRRVCPWWRRSSARRRPRCKAANWAGCSRTSSIPRWRPGAADAGRRDQQSGAGARRLFSIVTLQGKARDRPRHGHGADDAADVPAVHDAAQSAGADRTSSARRWTRRAPSAPACTVASRWSRWRRRTIRRGRRIRAKCGWTRSIRPHSVNCLGRCRWTRPASRWWQRTALRW